MKKKFKRLSVCGRCDMTAAEVEALIAASPRRAEYERREIEFNLWCLSQISADE